MKVFVSKITIFSICLFAIYGVIVFICNFVPPALSSIIAATWNLTPQHRVEIENATDEVLSVIVLSVNDRLLVDYEKDFKKWFLFDRNLNWLSHTILRPSEKREFSLPSRFEPRIGTVEIIACTEKQLTPLRQGVYISFVCWPWKNGKWEWRDSKGDWPLHHEIISNDDLQYIDASYLKKHQKSPVIEPLMALLLRASVSLNEETKQ